MPNRWASGIKSTSRRPGQTRSPDQLTPTAQCSLCHGEGLKGQGAAPALAGRSPSYMARQLWDFKSGARKGANSQMMLGVVNQLTPEDILNIVAYTASLTP